jgi:hypothetical protein
MPPDKLDPTLGARAILGQPRRVTAGGEVSLTTGIVHRAQLLRRHILETYQGRRVNIIAHSIGGFDARHLITHLGMADRVSSLTTVATPHRGTCVADWVLRYVGQGLGVEWILERLGVPTEAFYDLTTERCAAFNASTSDHPAVRYFSVGGSQVWYRIRAPLQPFAWLIRLRERALAGAVRDAATLEFLERQPWGAAVLAEVRAIEEHVARHGVRARDREAYRSTRGANDGVVPLHSAPWGESFAVADMDHLDQIGWRSGSLETLMLYESIVRQLASQEL